MGILGKKCNAQLFFFVMQAMLLTSLGCSKKGLQQTQTPPKYDRFVSHTYNHFEEGVLFSDIEIGLDVLWEASFINGRTYKENIGLFVPGGLLILPNKDNTCKSASLSGLPKQIKNEKLIVCFAGDTLEVLGIIHTHPDINSLRMPAPTRDYQYSYMGIHNYVLGYMDLFDAYKNSRGIEEYIRLGPRKAYHLLPFKSQPKVIQHPDFDTKVILTNNEHDFSFLEPSRRTVAR